MWLFVLCYFYIVFYVFIVTLCLFVVVVRLTLLFCSHFVSLHYFCGYFSYVFHTFPSPCGHFASLCSSFWLFTNVLSLCRSCFSISLQTFCFCLHRFLCVSFASFFLILWLVAVVLFTLNHFWFESKAICSIYFWSFCFSLLFLWLYFLYVCFALFFITL